LDKLITGARGNMKSTPYLVDQKDLNEESFSKLRTSKVMYMNEKLVPYAMDLSR
jgi:hypothetical protein